MAKLYSKKKLDATKMLPKKETIQLILNYSKALSVVKIGNMNFKTIANQNEHPDFYRDVFS